VAYVTIDNGRNAKKIYFGGYEKAVLGWRLVLIAERGRKALCAREGKSMQEKIIELMHEAVKA
jgi:hypothetical protein